MPSADAHRTSAEPSQDKDYLCTILPDLLFDIPTSANVRRNIMVIKLLRKCYENDRYMDEDEVCYIDLRGQCADDAKQQILENICNWPHPSSCLNAIVGCKVHGVGEGKLKKAIIDLLDLHKAIKYKIDWGGSVISISLVEGVPFDPAIAATVPDYSDEAFVAEMEAILEEEIGDAHTFEMECENLQLCTFACDFLFGLQMPSGQLLDEKMVEKVLAGFEKCYRDDSVKCIDGLSRVDLRGWFVEEAIEKLVKHLDQFSSLLSPGCVDVVVGCQLHGVGEGKLKQAVIAVLNSDKSIEFDGDKSDVIIKIKVKAPKDYSSLRGVCRELFLSRCDEDHSVLRCSGFKREKGGFKLEEGDFWLDKELSDDGDELLSVSVKEECFLYTIGCSLIFCHMEVEDKFQEQIMSGRELTRLGESEGVRMELCGRSVDDVVNLLSTYIDYWSRPPAPGSMNFIMGCKLHGFFERKVKDVISQLLERYNTYEMTLDGDDIFLTEFHRWKGKASARKERKE